LLRAGFVSSGATRIGKREHVSPVERRYPGQKVFTPSLTLTKEKSMKKLAFIAALFALAPCAVPAEAQKSSKDKEPKSTEGQVRKARKEDSTVRQVTPDPKKSPGKHADNLSKNVNHEMKRTAKRVTGALGMKKDKKHYDK
jgi:hypothetical protein